MTDEDNVERTPGDPYGVWAAVAVIKAAPIQPVDDDEDPCETQIFEAACELLEECANRGVSPSVLLDELVMRSADWDHGGM